MNIYYRIAAVVAAAGVAGVILWKTPIVELLWGFVMFFAIPMAFLVSLGVMTQQTFAAIVAGPAALRDRVEAELRKLKEGDKPSETESKPEGKAPAKRETKAEREAREQAEAAAAAKARAKEEKQLKKSLRILQTHFAALQAAEDAKPEPEPEAEAPAPRRRRRRATASE